MDRFEIHLRNLFAQAFGQNFTAGKLKIAFPEVAGVEICQIDVSPVDSAIIVSGKDKNGVGYERLYVRSGNSPPEMPLSEIPALLSKRFLQPYDNIWAEIHAMMFVPRLC
ncbi:MAG: hypothetical protein IPN50_03640 [Sphingomonadales bacterium]|jgi:hypothetical protein|uniref:hypothetical protein n=1 Tax=Sphingorhabdus sp. TaxID=1902408 RepID=UPI003BAF74F0|nr:hypothetical protein [Sphingomonadales bacterium]MBK9431538.1 hypothetical protein [Sphingomonadales bacterium]MBL0023183.1 hypothetical protein [Sphingomonadales bacterium]